MAGYRHITGPAGEFAGIEHLETLEAAEGALRECFGMIHLLASQLAARDCVSPGWDRAAWVRWASLNHRVGLRQADVNPGGRSGVLRTLRTSANPGLEVQFLLLYGCSACHTRQTSTPLTLPS